MINWPKDIIADIARRKCVLVVGTGVSKNSTNIAGHRPMDWQEFLEFGARATSSRNLTLIKQLIKERDFLTACEVIKRDLGHDKFTNIVKAEFLSKKFDPAAIHRHIYDLDSRIVITPNFDKIYDVYADHTAKGSVLVKNYFDEDVADCIRRTDRLILKVHGSITDPNKLIFSRKDYSVARTKFKNFYAILDALAITHTFIFIGCGVNDPDIRLLLEDYSFRFGYARKHYIVMPKNALHKEVLEIIKDTMNLEVISYDSKDYHKELTDSLGALVTHVEDERRELTSTQDW